MPHTTTVAMAGHSHPLVNENAASTPASTAPMPKNAAWQNEVTTRATISHA